jgi:FkbM family methyltransferase
MEKAYIKNLLKKDDPIIFEIGCADGTDTEQFLNQFSKIKLYAFEPEPDNLYTIKNKNFDKRFNLFEGVVSNINGSIDFLRSDGSRRHSGSIFKPKNHLNIWPEVNFTENIQVKSIKLDTFCEVNSINKIDFIWMDTQGAEGEIFKSGKNILKNTKYIYTEYSNDEWYENQPNLQTLIDILGENWTLKEKFQSDVLFENIN